MIKLRDILQEWVNELNVPTPEDAYPFIKQKRQKEENGYYYKYTWRNSNGDDMEGTVMVDNNKLESHKPGKSLYIAFGIHDTSKPFFGDDDDDSDKKYKTQTGAGDVLKVLATVVEMVKQVAEKEGGFDSVYELAWAPADSRRGNIYDHYISTLFPGFEKRRAFSSAFFKSFVNKKLSKSRNLTEVGEGSAQAYDWKKISSSAPNAGQDSTYRFVTDDKDKEGNELPPVHYRVTILGTISTSEKIIEYYVAFGIDKLVLQADGEFEIIPDYNTTSRDTQTGNLFRVMKTMLDIVNNVLDNQKEDPRLKQSINEFTTVIEMSPSKEIDPESGKENRKDMRRANLYMAYIDKHKPEGSWVRISSDGDTIQITIPPAKN